MQKTQKMLETQKISETLITLEKALITLEKALITLEKAHTDYDKISKEHENAELALDAAESARFVAVQDALDAYDASANPDLPPEIVVSLTRAMGFAYKAYEKTQAYCDETLVAYKNARLKLEAAKLNVSSTQAELVEFTAMVAANMVA